VKEGISEKLGNGVQFLFTFVIAVIMSLIRGWKLTLVILSISPVMILAVSMFAKVTGILTSSELKSYARAGAIVEEVLSAIRTVFAYNGSQKEAKRYETRLNEAMLVGIRKGFINGAMMGFLWLTINCAYALGFWYGWTLTETEGSSVGTILLVFFNILIGVFSLGNAGSLIDTITNARVAAYEIFNIIDRTPPIDSLSTAGEQPKELVGDIEFDNVAFKYPARIEAKILDEISFKIPTGYTVALVGDSGCGKSTCLQLLQRFYDPESGAVKLDGRSLKDLNIEWLRKQIGVVNQEPILFGTTIKENILFGKSDATDDEIVAAAKSANAHNFIMKLPDVN
jgi:ATP-binding cassette subfamily B (MDR/TAP) protein 1